MWHKRVWEARALSTNEQQELSKPGWREGVAAREWSKEMGEMSPRSKLLPPTQGCALCFLSVCSWAPGLGLGSTPNSS